MNLVFFDLDGTILNGFSSENEFIVYLWKHKIIRYKQLSAFTSFIRKWYRQFGRYVFIKNKSYLTGLSVKQIEILGDKFTRNSLLKKVRPNIKKLIEEHKENGDKVIMITGSLDLLAKVLAESLGIDEYYATSCVQKDGFFLNEPPISHPFGKEKLSIAEKICRKYKADLADCYAYGNSNNDLHILKAVGHPVAVTPHRKLLKFAKTKGWKVIRN